ncbi:LysR family transcriptional regulator [Arthrobacter sp. GCM10027362]|uniref:LysR family transcriptional regulator n=1 Tax=Arthrobacter sp. GCM10027362 TaxID=3273379 RepID=UPI00363DABFB
MNLRQLEYFLTVTAEGSFSRAAAVLHMTQPPLSQSVLQLEKDLGAQLLVRHPKGVTLTEAGSFLAAQGRELLSWSRHLEDQVRNMGRGLAGRLHVAAVPSVSWSHLPPLLKAFDHAAPGVEVELADPEPAEVLRQVADGSADVGFVATADPALLATAHTGITVDSVLAMPLVVALPPRLAHLPEPLDLALLAGQPWILPSRIPGFPGLIEIAEQVWQEGRIRPGSVRHVSTLQTAVPLISADMGIGLMPRSIAALAGSGIRFRAPVQPIPPLQAAMVRSRHMPPSPVLERFLEVARHTYTGEL